MGKLAVCDTRALTELLRAQDGVIARRQAVECQMTTAALWHRLRPDGPWKVLLPGVYLTNQGAMTTRQRNTAAFLFGGRAIAVTGLAALAWHGVRTMRADQVDVLVAPTSRRRDTGFARLHPTAIELSVDFRDGRLSYAPPARALSDAVRQLDDVADVRAVVAASVQQGKVHIWQLTEELDRGPVRGSARLRRALAEVAEGARSTAEIDLVRLIKRARLPMPMLNPRLFLGEDFLATPDAWWPDVAVAVEVDSREWHLSPLTWQQTMARHARMSAHGIIVLHYPPSRIRQNGHGVIAEIRSALDAAAGRRVPPVRALPAV